MRHQYSLADAVENLEQLDQAMLEGIMARDPLGFFVLCAPEEVEKSRLVGDQHLREIGSFLIERFDTVIVDGSRALDDLLLSCLELSESIFVLLTQEFPAVRNAQHYLSALARAGYGHEAVKLVVNRHDKRGPLHVSLEQLQQTLGAAPFWPLLTLVAVGYLGQGPLVSYLTSQSVSDELQTHSRVPPLGALQ